MKTARAVVIDEDPKEALHLLQALGCAGIGAAYFAGDDPDLFPTNPLDGIRVVFLDLKLINQPEVRQYIPHAVTVLKSCVRLQPRTTGIVCWSKHTDDFAALEQELSAQKIVPAFLLALDNKAEIVAKGSAGIADVITQFDRKLGEKHGHRLLVGWEEVSHVASSRSTDQLVALSKDDPDLIKLLAAVARAAADESPSSVEHTIRALCSGLVSIHHDAIEDLAVPNFFGDAGQAIHDQVSQSQNQPLTPEQRARLNEVLLTTSSSVLRPGNVYSDESRLGDDAAQTAFKRSFAEDLLPEAKNNILDAIARSSKVVGIEITPPCDHAAQKNASARLVLGLLIRLGLPVTEDKVKLPAKSRLFAKEIEPVQLHLPGISQSGAYKLILSARHLETRAISAIKNEKPLFRFRSSVVADIQAWFASHAARPGYVSIR